MSRTGARCVSCLAAALATLCALWTANAYAVSAIRSSEISAEFWLGLFFTVLLALVSAYVKGMERGFEKRIASLEFDNKQQATQINLLREDMLRDHPTKQETSQHREHVEEELRYIRTRLDEMVRTRR